MSMRTLYAKMKTGLRTVLCRLVNGAMSKALRDISPGTVACVNARGNVAELLMFAEHVNAHIVMRDPNSNGDAKYLLKEVQRAMQRRRPRDAGAYGNLIFIWDAHTFTACVWEHLEALVHGRQYIVLLAAPDDDSVEHLTMQPSCIPLCILQFNLDMQVFVNEMQNYMMTHDMHFARLSDEFEEILEHERHPSEFVQCVSLRLSKHLGSLDAVAKQKITPCLMERSTLMHITDLAGQIVGIVTAISISSTVHRGIVLDDDDIVISLCILSDTPAFDAKFLETVEISQHVFKENVAHIPSSISVEQANVLDILNQFACCTDTRMCLKLLANAAKQLRSQVQSTHLHCIVN